MPCKSRDEVRLLLLQIRDDPNVRIEEHSSFARHSGLDLDQIEIFNVFDRSDIPPDAAQGFHALLVGGASEASVLEPNAYPFVTSAQRLLRQCIVDDVPVFASCFGFQLAALALGGEVVHDDADFELGTVPIRLTPEAKHDPLMGDTPDGFLAVSVHRERAPLAPPGTIPLAFTHNCCHAFRVPGKPFWAFQFHPELDRLTLADRLSRYKVRYTGSDRQLEQVIASLKATPESNHLLEKFVDRILLSAAHATSDALVQSPKP